MNDVLVAWIEVDGALAHPNIVQPNLAHPNIVHPTITTESQQQQLVKEIRQTLQTSELKYSTQECSKHLLIFEYFLKNRNPVH